jgi:hypothetical protein
LYLAYLFLLYLLPRMESASRFSARLISYREASPLLISQALTAAQQELHARFPLADTTAWQQAFERCQPELWLAEEGPRVDHTSLIRVVNSLHIGQLPDDEADPPRYGPRTHHVARKLVRYGKWATSLLAQHPDLTTSEAQVDVRQLLLRLETGDGVAEQITEAFYRPSIPRLSKAPPPHPLSMEPPKPLVSVSPEPPALAVRWMHLQRWVAQQDDPLRPWNRAGIARQTQLPQSIVRILLETSPASEETAGLFTKQRLRLLQRLFRPFGYQQQDGSAKQENG